MSNVFILNPAASKLDLMDAMETRLGQASGICASMSTSVDGEDIEAIGKTFWAVERMLDEILELHIAITRGDKRGGDHA